MKTKKKKVSHEIFMDAVLPVLQQKHSDLAVLQKAIDEEYEVFEEDEAGKETAISISVKGAAAPAVETKAKTDAAAVTAVTQESIEAMVTKAMAQNEKSRRVDVSVGNDKREEDPKLGFKSFGHFAKELSDISAPGAAITEGMRVVKAFDERRKAISGLGTDAGSGAGFLIPPQFSTEIWDGMNKEPDSLMARTDNYPIQGESLTFPANAETSRANGSRYGGIQAYWRAEAAQITSSKPTFRDFTLKPHELSILAYVTNNMLRQAGSLQAYLMKAAGQELDFKIGDGIINGTGAGQPLGVLNANCLVTVNKEPSQDSTTIKGTNILKMWARLHSRSRANSAWFINQDIEPQLYGMSWVAVGNTGTALNSYLPFVPAGGPTGNVYPLLMGRPVIPQEYCATLGTVGDIILADMSAYATGQRGETLTDTSIHLRFDYSETAFRFTFEADGRPLLASAITPFKGTNTLSPFVVLQTR